MSQQSYNMNLLGRFNHNTYHSSCWGYSANGREYVIFGWYDGTSIIDITDDSNIREIFYIAGRQSGWREMKVYKNYLYVVSEADSSGIQVIDLASLPNTVSLVNTYFFTGYKRAHSISQSGHYLYINGGNYSSGGIVILDLEPDPANPVKLGEWEADYVHDSRIVNDTIWACNPLTGKVTIIDAVDKLNPVTLTSWVNGLYPVPHNCALSEDNKYLYVCDENFEHPGKLKIWDVSNKQDVIFMNEWFVPGTTHSVHNIEIYGRFACLSYYGEGAVILDLIDPIHPVPIAWYKTTACWEAIYFPSGKIAASDIYDGLYILKTIDPIGIKNVNGRVPVNVLFSNFPNPFNPVTNIKFSIQMNLHVKLSVYDILGKELEVLVNEKLDPGIYHADWDASDYPSVIYFYRLETEGFTKTNKMVVLK